ncbi:lipid-A-disaccharide synthase [Shimia marina]|uniref:Lipid-A-disaccharide synthase n=1 Tax=Shimia marina TaxID=321267 RepID=A0A0N7LSA7_9RHOB|nr:lipid-A-disaccharide synthase [Shimia marina]CUH53092.1 Lipid-A-disaccharide synthase [Shimia marina]SFE43478.1 lipid-A-disaccharide synthase [Shimia marina]
MKVFLVAGEMSGDRLGGALMEGLRQLLPNVEFVGVGGPLMAQQGLESLFPMDELSVMGIAEVLPKYRHLLRRMHETVEAVLAWQPDVLITIDSPDFCLRVAREVRAKADIRAVHYVAPSVWAWRPKRAEKMAKSVDQVLALLPFEPPYMEAVGLRCDFVGHPVVTEPVATSDQMQAFRAELGIGDAPLLVALPGSRRGEVSRLTPAFGEVVARLKQDVPDLQVVLPAAAPVADLVKETVAAWAHAPIVLDPRDLDVDAGMARKRAAFAAADVALAASGTVSLELAACDTPMVVAYDMSWLSWQIMSRMALIDTVTLVNLVSETRTVEEYLGPAFKAEDIAPALLRVLQSPESQRAAMTLTMQRLGRGHEAPGLRAARAVLDGLKA